MTTDRDAPILPECGDGDFSLGRDNVPWREKTERDKIEEKYKGTDRMMKVPNGMAANPSKDYDGIIASTGTSREMRESLEYALSPANQIKSADRNSGVFSFKDNSILKQEEIKSSIGDYYVG